MDRLQYLLMKLAEEAVEISQISLKSAQFGLNEKHPDLTETNKERIHAELNDLNGIITMLNCEYGFDYLMNTKAMYKKIDKVNHFYGYSKELGMVTDEELPWELKKKN